KPETKDEAKPAAVSASTSAPSQPVAAASSEKGSVDTADCRQIRVHFPFNSSEIDPAELPSLQRATQCLKADAGLHITIQGNADERGTQEYNPAPGDQRAIAVAHYMESLGASKTQLKTVSYGKENPICSDHDEACWSQNRRAELKTK